MLVSLVSQSQAQSERSCILTTTRSCASIGAVITILCLIFDPFIQGLISISERLGYKEDPSFALE